MTMTGQKLEIPLSVYDPVSGTEVTKILYFETEKRRRDSFENHMSAAEGFGVALPTSAQWFRARQWLEQNEPAAEVDFITGAPEWTRDALDYDREVIRVVDRLGHGLDLGPKDGFYLPTASAYVKDMPDNLMRTISYLWGVADPKRDLPDHAYLTVVTSGLKPVTRGGSMYNRGGTRFSASADRDPDYTGIAARFVSAKR